MTSKPSPAKHSTKSDVYARLQSGSTAGRGSIAGWTPCPLCCSVAVQTHPSDHEIRTTLSNLKSNKSIKLFSNGRGLAAHLHAVHTPWNPGKAELKRRRKIQRQNESEMKKRQQVGTDCENESDYFVSDHEERPKKRTKLNHLDVGVNCRENFEAVNQLKWDPSNEEIERWNQRVLEIVHLVEMHSKKSKLGDDLLHEVDRKSSVDIAGLDRSGNQCLSYRDSLPPFLAAAADGDMNALQTCINNYDPKSNDDLLDCKLQHIQSLILCRDRNGSTAEHWAAGGGHVHCLTYLFELRSMLNKSMPSKQLVPSSNNDPQSDIAYKKMRKRRDGKTALHYAARNGHTTCIDLIMSCPDAPCINTPSGDGTTPLHMACYGGHPSTVRHLIEKYNANAHAVNDWSCGVGHWTAMSLGDEGMDAVVELCNYLKDDCGVDFVSKQKQGHSPLHKAASKKNRLVIEWLAGKSKGCDELVPRFSEDELKRMGEPDKCGNIPSDIWLRVGGDTAFACWMKDACGW